VLRSELRPGRELQPPRVDMALAALAARQHGVVSSAQLLTLGLDTRAVHHRAATGRLHRIHRGVYAVGHESLSFDARRMAAVLACGDEALLSHRSAAAAWGLRETSRARWDITTPRRGRRSLPGMDLHTARSLAPDDATVLRGIPITSVPRTLVDLAAVLSADALERVVHQAEVLRLLDVAAVGAVLARSAGRRGTGRLRVLLAQPSPGPTRSALEERFLGVIRAARLPTPRLNAHVATAESLVEVDVLWPRHRVIVELDGAAAHQTRGAFQADRRRDAALAAEGYVVVRLTWQRVTRERGDVVRQLRRLLDLRGGCT
jgi:very-short-patch-repair endonuclease